MRMLFSLGHPAQFHVLKHVINYFHQNNQILVVYKSKDLLEELINRSDWPRINIQPRKRRKNNKLTMFFELIKREYAFFNVFRSFKPEIMVGSSVEIAHFGWIYNIPNFVMTDGDFNIDYYFMKLSYPFAKHILIPTGVDVNKYSYKTIFYWGYPKLAPLHPNVFIPNHDKVESLTRESSKFYIIRTVKFGAHHDIGGVKGISDELLRKLVSKLSEGGSVFISSERKLPDDLLNYRFPSNFAKEDIHHAIYYSSLLICDSQSMAVEAELLGVPTIRYNSWVGKVHVLNELENVYKLGYGIIPDSEDELFDLINKLLNDSSIRTVHQKNRSRMLSEKIDVNSFFIWLFENYPKSLEILKNNTDYQRRFIT